MSDFDKIVKKLGPDSINDWAGKVWSSSLSDIELPTEINPDNVAKTLQKMNKILVRDNSIEATLVNQKVLALVSSLVLKLSPFASVNHLDDEQTVLRALSAIETYFRLLSLERAQSCNIFHPTLFESCFQILTNVLQHYTQADKKSYIFTMPAKIVFTGPGAALEELFEKFPPPEQYMESTVKHLFGYFEKCAVGGFEQEQLDRAITQLGISKDETMFTEVSTYLCMLVGGRLLPPGTAHLNKFQTLHQKRAYQIVLKIVKKCPETTRSWLIRMADLTPSRQVCANLYFNAAKDIIKQASEKQQKEVVSTCAKLMRYKNVKIRANMLILAKAALSLYDTECKLSSSVTSYLLKAMMARTRDTSANVQQRSLLYIAELLHGQMANMNESLLAPGGLQPSQLRRYSNIRRSGASTQSDLTTNSEAMRRTVCENILFNNEERGAIQMSFCQNASPLDVITKIAQSNSLYVRKAVLDFTKGLVMQRLIKVEDEKLHNIFDLGCRDMLLSVRMHALSVLSSLAFEYHELASFDVTADDGIDTESPADKMIRFWLKTIIPMVEDRDKSVSEKAYSELFERVIMPLVQFENHYIYQVLSALDEVELNEFYVNMSKLMQKFQKDAKLSIKQWELLAKRMYGLLDGNAAYPWIILNLVFTNQPHVVDVDKVINAWTENMETLIKDSRQAAKWSTKLIRKMILSRPDEQRNVITLICQKYMKVISMDTHLMQVICNIFRDINDEDYKKWITQDAFTMGQLKKLINRIEDLPDDDVGTKVTEVSFRTSVMSMFYDYYHRDEQLQLCNLIIEPFASDEIEPKFAPFTSSAIWSLGRICCVDHTEAERIVPFFGTILQSHLSSDTAKIGALGAIADLCRVKTQLADKFIDVIATMMEDKSLAVVVTALKLMTYMLRQDYVKMRSSLLSRMLILAANESAAKSKNIKELAEYCLNHVIAPRQEDLFIGHFTQIMILCTGATMLQNPGQDKLLSTQTQKSVTEFGGFFNGNANRDNRRKIYDFCIVNMTTKQQLRLLEKLKFEVFEAPQRNSDLFTGSNEMVEILHDALVLVHQHPLLQFPVSAGSTQGGDEDDFFESQETTQKRSKSSLQQACSLARIAYIEKSLFAEFFDLRETLKLHKSGASIYINRLMKSLMQELPSLKEIDPKYRELEAELDRQLQSWEELGIQEPEQIQMSTVIKSKKSDKRRRSMLQESVAEMNSMCSRRSGAGLPFEDVDKENESVANNCPNSTPFPSKEVNPARFSAGGSTIHGASGLNDPNVSTGTMDQTDSFVFNLPAKK